jgi:hypothetical protein
VALSPVDTEAAASEEQAPAADRSSSPAGAPSSAPAGTAAPVERACASCGGSMLAGQDWCLHCGAGAPGSLGAHGWRSATGALVVIVVLALGAAAAAYAALEKSSGKARVVTSTVAQVPPPSTTAPSTIPRATLPSTPGTATTPKTGKGLLGFGGAKPPKIPLTAPTPKSSKTSTGTEATKPKKTTTTPTSTTPTNTSTGGATETDEESQQAAIVLDPDAATTYNPYEFPASAFGDPSLAIDDDPTTAWTAQVNPASAPKMAEGLLIDLKSKQKLGVAQIITSTPGITIQLYGAKAQTAPTSITAPEWIPLSAPKLMKKKRLRITLRHSKEAFTFITLWISSAPQSAVGTAQAPGHVDVNELELFPAS